MRTIAKKIWRVNCLVLKQIGAAACILIGVKQFKDVWDKIR